MERVEDVDGVGVDHQDVVESKCILSKNIYNENTGERT